MTYSLILKHKKEYILQNEEIKKKQHIYLKKLKLFNHFSFFFQLLTLEKWKDAFKIIKTHHREDDSGVVYL